MDDKQALFRSLLEPCKLDDMPAVDPETTNMKDWYLVRDMFNEYAIATVVYLDPLCLVKQWVTECGTDVDHITHCFKLP
jgi:hypothetical protein